MRSSKSSPLGVVLFAILMFLFFSPAKSTIPAKDADAIRARFGVLPGVAMVFINPG